jgi:hypothetical protein
MSTHLGSTFEVVPTFETYLFVKILKLDEPKIKQFENKIIQNENKVMTKNVYLKIILS